MDSVAAAHTAVAAVTADPGVYRAQSSDTVMVRRTTIGT
jgi:hypothetical protein